MSTYQPQNEPRVNAAAPMPVAGDLNVADPHVSDVSPLSDPFGSGILGHSAAPLYSGGHHGGGGGIVGGDVGAHGSPLEGIEGQVSEAIEGNPSGEYPPLKEEAPATAPARGTDEQLIRSDAQPVQRGIFNVGGRMVHLRPMSGPTGADAPGPGFAATDLGGA